jgi:hypothetical protein
MSERDLQAAGLRFALERVERNNLQASSRRDRCLFIEGPRASHIAANRSIVMLFDAGCTGVSPPDAIGLAGTTLQRNSHARLLFALARGRVDIATFDTHPAIAT